MIQGSLESPIFGLLSPAKASENVHTVVYFSPVSIKIKNIVNQTPTDWVDDQPVVVFALSLSERK